MILDKSHIAFLVEKVYVIDIHNGIKSSSDICIRRSILPRRDLNRQSARRHTARSNIV